MRVSAGGAGHGGSYVWSLRVASCAPRNKARRTVRGAPLLASTASSAVRNAQSGYLLIRMRSALTSQNWPSLALVAEGGVVLVRSLGTRRVDLVSRKLSPG